MEWGVVGTGGVKVVRVWEVTDIPQARLKARQPQQPGKPELQHDPHRDSLTPGSR